MSRAEGFQASSQTTVALPIAQVWQRLRDFRAAPNYVPDLTHCIMHEGPSEGVGASRRVFLNNGRWLDETITEWREGEGFTLRLHRAESGAPTPFVWAEFSYQLRELESGETELTNTMRYQLRWGWLGRLLGWALTRWAMPKSLGEITQNQSRFYLTGKPTNPAFDPSR